jgi:prepilin-type processing-associated H-X9-DG protein
MIRSTFESPSLEFLSTGGNVGRRVRSAWIDPAAPRTGLTVVELIVVVAVIAVLLALLLPAVASVRESARRLQCANHLHQIGTAFHAYHDAHRALPPGWQVDSIGSSAVGWLPMLAPLLERSDLPSDADFLPLDAPRLEPVRNSLIPVMLCPSDNAERSFGLYAEREEAESGHLRGAGEEHEELLISLPAANYVGVFGTTDPDDVPGTSGNGALIEGRPIRFAEFHRGLTESLLVGERTARKLPSTWIGFLLMGEDAPARVVGFADKGPNRDDADECEFDSRHPDLANFLWGDGHVEAIADSIAADVYRRLARRMAQ